MKILLDRKNMRAWIQFDDGPRQEIEMYYPIRVETKQFDNKCLSFAFNLGRIETFDWEEVDKNPNGRR